MKNRGLNYKYVYDPLKPWAIKQIPSKPRKATGYRPTNRFEEHKPVVGANNNDCLAAPYCDQSMDGYMLACRKHWFQLPRYLRSLLNVACVKGRGSSKLREDLLKQAQELLRKKGAKRERLDKDRERYTVVR